MPDWRDGLLYLAMWGMRLLPVSVRAKERLVWLASGKVLATALALIPDDEGRLLVLKARYSGAWLLPGGAVHPGEQPLAGVRRECREELGLDVRVRALAGVWASGAPGYLHFIFDCGPLPGPPRLGPEHEA